jgi:hypothetical protein
MMWTNYMTHFKPGIYSGLEAISAIMSQQIIGHLEFQEMTGIENVCYDPKFLAARAAVKDGDANSVQLIVYPNVKPYCNPFRANSPSIFMMGKVASVCPEVCPKRLSKERCAKILKNQRKRVKST